MTRSTHDSATTQRECCRDADGIAPALRGGAMATWAHCIRTGLSLLNVVSFAKGDPD